MFEHAMDLDQAKRECDCKCHYGEYELVVAELLPPNEANPPRKMPILAFVYGPEQCDGFGLDPAVSPREDESAEDHRELLEVSVHNLVYFLRAMLAIR